MSYRRRITAGLLAVVGTAGLTAAGCGSAGSDKASGNAVDKAFASEMTAHHQGALDMAGVARTRAGHREIRTLASSIVSTQTPEIAQLKTATKDLGGSSEGHSGGAMHGGHDMASQGNLRTLGLSEAQAGMMHDANALTTAKPFDRAFIDMMVPHHQGAIRMARVELAKGKNAKLKALAQRIISAQSGEIGQMNSWRQGWYRAPSPSGGIPS
ncbi:MAG: DUF305 domain-containing protein [Actinomycetota bacterium]|nr:DUF305 domain-containing protein [Actinomycetota bacterium]